MKNIFVSELLTQTDLPCLPHDATMADLINIVKKSGKTSQFYLTGINGDLKGIIRLKDVLEYLSPHFLMTGRDQIEALAMTLESVSLKYLIREDYPSISVGQSLPNVMETLLLSGSSTVPVLNQENILVGEITCEQLLRVLPVKEKEACCAFS